MHLTWWSPQASDDTPCPACLCSITELGKQTPKSPGQGPEPRPLSTTSPYSHFLLSKVNRNTGPAGSTSV